MMNRWIKPVGFVSVTALMASAAPSHTPTMIDQLAVDQPDNMLSVMTYNVHGLPWPVAQDRDDALVQIGARLAQMRQAGRAPDVVVLQEAFTDEAKAIARRSGYRHVIFGNDAPSAGGLVQADAIWWRGEGVGATLDSGLVILSDRPLAAVHRQAFAARDCAGYDCLAAKGVLVARVTMADGQQVDVATAHLNSRTASGVGHDRSRAAWLRQLGTLATVVRRRQASGAPLILTGDFNVGKDEGRRRGFRAAWSGTTRHVAGHDGLRWLGGQGGQLSPDLRYALERGRDWSLSFNGRATRITPVSATAIFGRNGEDGGLSDHVGYAITYRVRSIS